MFKQITHIRLKLREKQSCPFPGSAVSVIGGEVDVLLTVDVEAAFVVSVVDVEVVVVLVLVVEVTPGQPSAQSSQAP